MIINVMLDNNDDDLVISSSDDDLMITDTVKLIFLI